jgi:hypothetical protein
VDVGVGRRRPFVALVELERRKPVGGSDGGCEGAGDDGGIGEVARSAGIVSANRSALEMLDAMKVNRVI